LAVDLFKDRSIPLREALLKKQSQLAEEAAQASRANTESAQALID